MVYSVAVLVTVSQGGSPLWRKSYSNSNFQHWWWPPLCFLRLLTILQHHFPSESRIMDTHKWLHSHSLMVHMTTHSTFSQQYCRTIPSCRWCNCLCCEASVPSHIIQALGCWSSETFKIYIQNHPTLLAAIVWHYQHTWPLQSTIENISKHTRTYQRHYHHSLIVFPCKIHCPFQDVLLLQGTSVTSYHHSTLESSQANQEYHLILHLHHNLCLRLLPGLQEVSIWFLIMWAHFNSYGQSTWLSADYWCEFCLIFEGQKSQLLQ
jgi:hypothetical protein